MSTFGRFKTAFRRFKLISFGSIFIEPTNTIYEAQDPIKLTNDYLETEYLTQQFTGCSVTVIKNGDIVYSNGFGYSDIGNRIKMTCDSVMRIASISKSITSIAIAQLIKENKLDLNKRIEDYIKDYPLASINNNELYSITIYDLLSHRSGIRHYKDNEFNSNKHYNDSISTLNIFKNDPILFKPGTNYLYSVKYILL